MATCLLSRKFWGEGRFVKILWNHRPVPLGNPWSSQKEHSINEYARWEYQPFPLETLNISFRECTVFSRKDSSIWYRNVLIFEMLPFSEKLNMNVVDKHLLLHMHACNTQRQEGKTSAGPTVIELLSNIEQTTHQNAYLLYERLASNQRNLLSNFCLLSSSVKLAQGKKDRNTLAYIHTFNFVD